MDITEKLALVVRKLNIAQVGLLIEMAQAMTLEIEEFVNEGSDLLEAEFVINFSNRLIIHHATHVGKLALHKCGMSQENTGISLYFK